MCDAWQSDAASVGRSAAEPMADAAFWKRPFVTYPGCHTNVKQAVGSIHPSTNVADGAPTNKILIRNLQNVRKALASGELDASKIGVVPHEHRSDIWFIKFSNLHCAEWAGHILAEEKALGQLRKA